MPVLVQLEKIDGVKSAMANHTGSLVRVSLVDSADADSIAAELDSILKKQNRKPKRLEGSEVADAIDSEQWRATDKVGELSEIEFRTVFERRVKQFTEENDLDDDTIAKLFGFSSEILDETPASNADTNWGEFCGGMAARMLEKAKTVLDEDQIEALATRLKARVIG